MLQFSPFLKVRQADTHIASFEPRVAPALAAVGTDVTGWTVIAFVRLSAIDGPFEDVPSFFDASFAEVVFGNRKRNAEIHLAVGSDGEAALPAGAFDKRR